MARIPKHPITIYKPTDDDWWGNFDNNTVELSFRGNINRKHRTPNVGAIYRISVWGNDDFGMDRDFSSIKKALAFFKKVEQLPVLNQKQLLSMGFNWF